MIDRERLRKLAALAPGSTLLFDELGFAVVGTGEPLTLRSFGPNDFAGAAAALARAPSSVIDGKSADDPVCVENRRLDLDAMSVDEVAALVRQLRERHV